MDDPRTAEGVEHLQTAARELLKAARSFLDVVEDVVEDPDRIGGAAAGLADLVTSALKRTPAPWERAAWGDDHQDGDDPQDDAPGDDSARDDHDDLWGPDEPPDDTTPPSDGATEPVDVDEAEAPEEPVTRPRRPAAPRRRAPASRVRRIAVD